MHEPNRSSCRRTIARRNYRLQGGLIGDGAMAVIQVHRIRATRRLRQDRHSTRPTASPEAFMRGISRRAATTPRPCRNMTSPARCSRSNHFNSVAPERPLSQAVGASRVVHSKKNAARREDRRAASLKFQGETSSEILSNHRAEEKLPMLNGLEISAFYSKEACCSDQCGDSALSFTKVIGLSWSLRPRRNTSRASGLSQ